MLPPLLPKTTSPTTRRGPNPEWGAVWGQQRLKKPRCAPAQDVLEKPHALPLDLHAVCSSTKLEMRSCRGEIKRLSSLALATLKRLAKMVGLSLEDALSHPLYVGL